MSEENSENLGSSKIILEKVDNNTFVYCGNIILHDKEKIILPQILLYKQANMSEKELFEYILDFLTIYDYETSNLDCDFILEKNNNNITIMIEGFQYDYLVQDNDCFTDGYFTFMILNISQLLSFTINRHRLGL